MFARAKTGLLFLLMTGALLGVGYVIGFVADAWQTGLVAMLAVSVLIGTYSYFFSKNAALRANRARIVTEQEEPRLHAIVRDLSFKAGLPMPEVGIADTMMPNAFATGRNPANAAVVATRGLMQMLSDDELKGVFAHELSHVKNRDILVMSVVSTMAATISYTARYAAWFVLMDGKYKAQAMMIALILSITAPAAALMIQLGISRSREYLADESAALMTGDPLALASALRRIDGGCAAAQERSVNPSYANLMIANPLKGRNKTLLSGMFRTHPPIEERIRRLEVMAGRGYLHEGRRR